MVCNPNKYPYMIKMQNNPNKCKITQNKFDIDHQKCDIKHMNETQTNETTDKNIIIISLRDMAIAARMIDRGYKLPDTKCDERGTCEYAIAIQSTDADASRHVGATTN